LNLGQPTELRHKLVKLRLFHRRLPARESPQTGDSNIKTKQSLNLMGPQRVFQKIPPVIFIQSQFGMRVRLRAGDEVSQLLQWIARMQSSERFGDLGEQVVVNIHAS
ncbi:MAG: hypothetical protein WC807_17055, partial [Hyphomicrobium sp.]